MPIYLNKGRHSNSLRKIAHAHLQKLVAFLSIVKAKRVPYATAYATEKLGEVFNVPASKIDVTNHGVGYNFWSVATCETAALSSYGL